MLAYCAWAGRSAQDDCLPVSPNCGLAKAGGLGVGARLPCFGVVGQFRQPEQPAQLPLRPRRISAPASIAAAGPGRRQLTAPQCAPAGGQPDGPAVISGAYSSHVSSRDRCAQRSPIAAPVRDDVEKGYAEVAKVFRQTPLFRAINAMGTAILLRVAVGPRNAHVIMVRGRRSGKRYATPARVVEAPEGRYIVSAFGETNTIKNLRAAGVTTVIRGRRREDVRLVELPEADRVPMLRAYLKINPGVSEYFGATADSSDDALAQAAREHTVFRLEAT